MALSTDAGKNYREISPSCGAFTYTPNPCDPAPQFIAPFTADVTQPDPLGGGRRVHLGRPRRLEHALLRDGVRLEDRPRHPRVDDRAGRERQHHLRGLVRACRATPTRASRSSRASTRTPAARGTRCTRRTCRTGSSPASRSTATNPNHVLVTFGGFSRRWIPGGSVGHVFESWNGGTDVDEHHRQPARQPRRRRRARPPQGDRRDRPRASSSPVTAATRGRGSATACRTSTRGLSAVSPNRTYVVAATHGRGQWKITIP